MSVLHVIGLSCSTSSSHVPAGRLLDFAGVAHVPPEVYATGGLDGDHQATMVAHLDKKLKAQVEDSYLVIPRPHLNAEGAVTDENGSIVSLDVGVFNKVLTWYNTPDLMLWFMGRPGECAQA
jgi:hypothetical protein